MGLLSTPLDDKTMQKMYPMVHETDATEILKKMTKNLTLLLCLAACISLVCFFIGKKLFGMLSYNLTFKIRKELYANVLQKNIGYFDFPENSTPVLSSVM
jgi:hypothetical protein